MTRNAERIKQRVHDYRQQIDEHLEGAASVRFMQEAFNSVVADLLRIEEEGWISLNQLSDLEKGFSLEDIQKTTLYLEKQVKTNNLLGRGLRLRNNHAFGRGFEIEAKEGQIAPRHQKIIDDPENQQVLFSPLAMRELNRILFTSGNLMVMYDSKTKKFIRLAIDLNIKNYISYDDNPSRIKYFLRTWETRDDLSTGAQPTKHEEWVPVSTYKAANPNLPKTIKVGNEYIKVNQTAVIIDSRNNKDNGEVWGVPDALDAAPWAWAANTSMKNGVKLWDAQTAIALIVKANNQAAQKAAGAQIQRKRVGQAAIAGPGTELHELPKNAMVDLYGVRPLIAQVALALDVSVSALSADVGKGGARAAEQTLEGPELLAALSRQEEFTDFLERCFAAMGAKNITINFHRLDSDPLHRLAQTATLFRINGGINQEEYRELGLEIMDIKPTTTAMPEPDEFTGSKAATLANASLMDDPDTANNSVASQGNSGAVGSLDDAGGNSARDDDAAAGSA